MKAFISILTLGFTLIISVFKVNAQEAVPIAAYPLTISQAKTTNIIFPQAIISVDRGSRYILAQKAKGVENILQVKAARDSFPETNLSVITADGRLNSFVVNYSSQPPALNLSIAESAVKNSITFSEANYNKAEVTR